MAPSESTALWGWGCSCGQRWAGPCDNPAPPPLFSVAIQTPPCPLADGSLGDSLCGCPQPPVAPSTGKGCTELSICKSICRATNFPPNHPSSLFVLTSWIRPLLPHPSPWEGVPHKC